MEDEPIVRLAPPASERGGTEIGGGWKADERHMRKAYFAALVIQHKTFAVLPTLYRE